MASSTTASRHCGEGIVALILPAIFFALLAFLLKRRESITALRRAAGEIRVNLALYTIDTLIMLPFLGVLAGSLRAVMRDFNLILPVTIWQSIGVWPTLFAVVFLGDFIGYWRHRFEHTSVLWPTHAVHHSDTEMNWLTLQRFHPINRITTTVIDSAFLLALGFPAWAAVANGLVRHYYGYFIHADLPWTYGPLGKVFVSPAMHRWHHARSIATPARISPPCSQCSIWPSALSSYPAPAMSMSGSRTTWARA